MNGEGRDSGSTLQKASAREFENQHDDEGHYTSRNVARSVCVTASCRGLVGGYARDKVDISGLSVTSYPS